MRSTKHITRRSPNDGVGCLTKPNCSNMKGVWETIASTRHNQCDRFWSNGSFTPGYQPAGAHDQRRRAGRRRMSSRVRSGESVRDFVIRHLRGQVIEHVIDCRPHAPDARLAHLSWFDGDDLPLVHVIASCPTLPRPASAASKIPAALSTSASPVPRG